MLGPYVIGELVSTGLDLQSVFLILVQQEGRPLFLSSTAGEVRDQGPKHEEHEKSEEYSYPACFLGFQLIGLPFSFSLIERRIGPLFGLGLRSRIWTLGVVRVLGGIEVLAIIWLICSLPGGLGRGLRLIFSSELFLRGSCGSFFPFIPPIPILFLHILTIPIKIGFFVVISEVFVGVGDLVEELFGFWIGQD